MTFKLMRRVIPRRQGIFHSFLSQNSTPNPFNVSFTSTQHQFTCFSSFIGSQSHSIVNRHYSQTSSSTANTNEDFNAMRHYFFYVDLQGHLYNINKPDQQNLPSGPAFIKDCNFLRFFFKQIRHFDDVRAKPPADAADAAASSRAKARAHVLNEENLRLVDEYMTHGFTHLSPCGVELNFLKAADKAIVFTDLKWRSELPAVEEAERVRAKRRQRRQNRAQSEQQEEADANDEDVLMLEYATDRLPGSHGLGVRFDAKQLVVGAEKGRMYHPLHVHEAAHGDSVRRAYGLVRSQLCVELGDRFIWFNDEGDAYLIDENGEKTDTPVPVVNEDDIK